MSGHVRNGRVRAHQAVDGGCGGGSGGEARGGGRSRGADGGGGGGGGAVPAVAAGAAAAVAPDTSRVATWRMNDVCAWLEEEGLGELVPAFRRNAVGKRVCGLTA